MPRTKQLTLSKEQENFIQLAKQGKNILVDACIGSGKTTVIQHLCNQIKDKSILYLTYNKLLKIDAQGKIKGSNVLVQNYHGFAWKYLDREGIHVGQSDLIQAFLKHTNDISVTVFDMIIIDEYQDIDQELADMLEYIKSLNDNMQIIAVGDMEQKIYDKTRLEADKFIKGFLGEFERIEFTQCFRINKELASRLGNIWNKTIVGVNDNCIVEEMDIQEVYNFLAQQKCKDILCLGMRDGIMTSVLNGLEREYPKKFNKNTVYASIRAVDKNNIAPKVTNAIFTTFDSSKGLERKICVIFDWTQQYWDLRISKQDTRHKILRNIFCVAASRGKERIIFVNHDNSERLADRTLKIEEDIIKGQEIYAVSTMFDFKYKEDIENSFKELEVKRIAVKDNNIIEIKDKDGLIDLGPCIGNMQEASYFNKYDIDSAIDWYKQLYKAEHKSYKLKGNSSLEEKILYMTALETNQDRYMVQVKIPYIEKEKLDLIHKRLSERLEKDVDVQKNYEYCDVNNSVFIRGRIDAIKDNIVYELKFVDNLSHEHFLQCACYMIMIGLELGILWNTKDNTVYEVRIKDRSKFMQKVEKTITKGRVK